LGNFAKHLSRPLQVLLLFLMPSPHLSLSPGAAFERFVSLEYLGIAGIKEIEVLQRVACLQDFPLALKLIGHAAKQVSLLVWLNTKSKVPHVLKALGRHQGTGSSFEIKLFEETLQVPLLIAARIVESASLLIMIACRFDIPFPFMAMSFNGMEQGRSCGVRNAKAGRIGGASSQLGSFCFGNFLLYRRFTALRKSNVTDYRDNSAA
jgi:hypothetical protein